MHLRLIACVMVLGLVACSTQYMGFNLTGEEASNPHAEKVREKLLSCLRLPQQMQLDTIQPFTMEIAFSRDGRVTKTAITEFNRFDKQLATKQLALEIARYLEGCAPYALSENEYEQWKVMEIRVDPKKIPGRADCVIVGKTPAIRSKEDIDKIICKSPRVTHANDPGRVSAKLSERLGICLVAHGRDLPEEGGKMTIRIRLDEEGNISKMLLVDDKGIVKTGQIDAQLRAVLTQCSPLQNLPKDKYYMWDEVDLYFYNRKLLKISHAMVPD